MKTAHLLLASALVLTHAQAVRAWETMTFCYRVLIDGKDRSDYQYVNSHFVTFADPAWKENPAVDEARLVDVRSGREERAPVIHRANFIPTRRWGGVMFEHIPFGKVLTLRIGANHVTFQRVDPHKAITHQDFRLDDRQEGYEVLQYCPYEMCRSLGPVGSHIHLEGPQTILKTTLLFTECHATLSRAGDLISRPVPIQAIGGSALAERFPVLGKVIREEWGTLFTYLIFPALELGDELKIVVSLQIGSPQSQFYVRKIE